MSIPWWGYVILAGLSWGTYVPIIFYGGTELTTKPGTIGGRLASILCVGVAYFVMAVIVPLILMGTREDARPEWKTNGLIFSGLAGIAGAVGAICVIFASKAAVDTAKDEYNAQESVLVQKVAEAPEADKPALQEQLKEFQANKQKYWASYRIYIAPLIFCLAPMINTLMSLIWHPKPGNPFGQESWLPEMPTWHLPLGIVLIAAGVFLVLYSKEAMEANKAAPAPKPTPSTGS